MDDLSNTIKLQSYNIKNVAFDSQGYVLPNQGDIAEHVVCVRPSNRKKVPVISTKEIKSGNQKKYLINNYGHSGMGYTIHFGSIYESINQMNSLIKDIKSNKDVNISVIGLGIIGLSTAIYLKELGFKNVSIVGDKVTNIPSTQCGALVEVAFSLDKEEERKFFYDLFEVTFKDYNKIYSDKSHYLNKAVNKIDYYVDQYGEPGLMDLSKKGIIPPVKKVKVFLDTNKNKIYELYKFESYLVDTELYMKALNDKAIELGISIVKGKKINNVLELENSPVIFNCAGLGGFALNDQINEAYPICGHGVIIKDPYFKISKQQQHFNKYCLVLTTIPGLENKEYNGELYFMPRGILLVGGTFVENYYGDDENINKKEITNIVKRLLYVLQGENTKF